MNRWISKTWIERLGLEWVREKKRRQQENESFTLHDNQWLIVSCCCCFLFIIFSVFSIDVTFHWKTINNSNYFWFLFYVWYPIVINRHFNGFRQSLSPLSFFRTSISVCLLQQHFNLNQFILNGFLNPLTFIRIHFTLRQKCQLSSIICSNRFVFSIL